MKNHEYRMQYNKMGKELMCFDTHFHSGFSKNNKSKL